MTQQVHRPLHRLVDLQGRLHGLLPGAREILQVADDALDALRAGVHVADQVGHRLAHFRIRQPADEKFAVLIVVILQDGLRVAPRLGHHARVHHRQIVRVVDLVRHAGNQRAERGHLVGLYQLQFLLARFFLQARAFVHLAAQAGIGAPQVAGVGAQAIEQVDQIGKQHDGNEIEQDAVGLRPCLHLAVVLQRGVPQRPYPCRGRGRQQLTQQVVHLRQHVDDQVPVQGEGMQIVLEQGRAGHVVERRSDFVADRPLRRAHEAQHGVGQGADGAGHGAVVRRRLRAEDVAGVQEIHQRVAQQGVVGLEVFEQRFLLLHGARQVREVPADGGAERLGGRFVPGFQVCHGAVQAVHGLRQRIVMGQQTGARQQHVTVQLGVVHLKDVQRLVHVFPQTRIRVLAAQQQKRQQQQEAADDQKSFPRNAHHGSSSPGRVSNCPWYSPVRVCRNCTMISISSGCNGLPSCRVAIRSTAVSRVCTRPSW